MSSLSHTEYVTARFGQEDSASYAVFTITDQLETDMLYLSMFLRTRKESGLLVLLANSTTEYLKMWLEKGKLMVQVNNLKTLMGKSVVNDGEIHFVSITIKEGIMTLQESNHEFGAMGVQPVSLQFEDVVYVGGLLDGHETSAFGGYFKGCLQDLQLNERKLEFFPLDASVMSYRPDRMVDVTPGCTSDDSCSVSYNETSKCHELSNARGQWLGYTISGRYMNKTYLSQLAFILLGLDESLHP